jgi:hypothetical protein
LINALLTTRIVVQFVGQIGAVLLLRKLKPGMERPFRMWLYPLPALLALVGWVFLYATAGGEMILYSLLALALGAQAFMVWSRRQRKWPFAESIAAKAL